MTLHVLITGAAGFTGRYVAEEAHRHGALVFGLSRRPIPQSGIVALLGDLAMPDSAIQAVRESVPDFVVHLASQTPANTSGLEPQGWLSGNPLITYNLLEAVRLQRPQARVLIVSSSAVYGHVPEADMPIEETTPLRPTTMYGVSKAAQELVAARFAAEHGLHTVAARPFNLVGPGEPPTMLTSTLAEQVAAIAAGDASPVVRMRHRATARDFTDIRDAARAYWRLLESGSPGEVYNVCSGTATPVGEIADRLLRLAGVTADIEETGGAPSANDVLVQAGDNRRIAVATGWQPAIDLDRSLADLLASLRRDERSDRR